jgi:hypothetical protein
MRNYVAKLTSILFLACIATAGATTFPSMEVTPESTTATTEICAQVGDFDYVAQSFQGPVFRAPRFVSPQFQPAQFQRTDYRAPQFQRPQPSPVQFQNQQFQPLQFQTQQFQTRPFRPLLFQVNTSGTSR